MTSQMIKQRARMKRSKASEKTNLTLRSYSDKGDESRRRWWMDSWDGCLHRRGKMDVCCVCVRERE